MRVTVRIPMDVEWGWRTVRWVIDDLTYTFGGTTVCEGRGTWVDSDGDVVYNKVWIVESFAECEDETELGWEVYSIASQAQEIMGESTVMYTINGNAYFT